VTMQKNENMVLFFVGVHCFAHWTNLGMLVVLELNLMVFLEDLVPTLNGFYPHSPKKYFEFHKMYMCSWIKEQQYCALESFFNISCEDIPKMHGWTQLSPHPRPLVWGCSPPWEFTLYTYYSTRWKALFQMCHFKLAFFHFISKVLLNTLFSRT
jgi:hypothetical protein